MCLPAAAAAAASPYLIGAQTGFSLLGAASNYKRQLSVAADAADQANRSAVLQYGQLQVRQEQEAAKAAQEIQANVQKAREAQSALSVSTGESGVAGNTVTELHAGFTRAAGEYEGAVIRNKAFLDANFRSQGEAVEAGARAQAANAYAQVQPPNYMGILLQGVGNYFKLQSESKSLDPIADVNSPAALPKPSNDISPSYAYDISSEG